MVALFLVVLGVLSRLVMHAPNFSPVLAIALFSGMYVDRRYSVAVPLVLMIITDCILGLHSAVAFTWGSVAVISVLGMSLQKRTLGRVALSGFVSAVVFFIVTNFGVWLTTGMYARSVAGLTECYAAGIPFFRYSAVSTVLYSIVLFAGYEVVCARFTPQRIAVRTTLSSDK